MAVSVPFEDVMVKQLREDAAFRQTYLQIALEDFQLDGNREVLMASFRQVIKAEGKEAEVAALLELSPATLQQNLREQAPSLLQMQKILHVLGYRLRLETEESKQNSEALEAMAV